MYIEKLIIKNFRNFINLAINFSSRNNFILGQNGVGKTNIIEAITILSSLKSFRNVSDSDIIRWGEDSYFCSSNICEDNCRKFEVGCAAVSGKLKKRSKIDDNIIGKASEYYGNLLTVVFSPDDMLIIDGQPEERRRFFDSIISKIYPEYLYKLSSFKKILVSRNRILRDIREKGISRNNIDVWDGMFAETAYSIFCSRNSFVTEFTEFFKDSYLSISRSKECPDIRYSSSIENYSSDEIFNKLKNLIDRDIARGNTGIGPQRDDYIFHNDKQKNFTNYASQGEKRTAAISLRISEINFIEKLRKKKAIILIDDIFSELDKERRESMVEIFNSGNQVIYTMIDMDYNDYKLSDQKTFLLNRQGIVEEI